MYAAYTQDKKSRIQKLGLGLLNKPEITICMISSFVGNLTASMELVPHGRLHYMNLEWVKATALKINRFNFDASCCLSNVVSRTNATH